MSYLRELTSQGFEVDYTDTLADITPERLGHFNAVVLFVTPDAREVSEDLRSSQPDLDARFVSAIEQYVNSGGGVFLMPGEMNVGKQRLGAFTDRWGARLPAEVLVEHDSRNVARPPRLRGTELAFTDNVLQSPVTEGVQGIWYPCDPVYVAAMTEPLIVDGNWQVVVRATTTTTTRPIDVHRVDAAPGLLVRTKPERESALMAIRALGRGRVALIAEWPQFSVGSGTKWIYDRAVLDRGVEGRPSDFAHLLSNTFHWLSEPSLSDHALGGWVTVRARLAGPNAAETVRSEYRSQPPHYDPADLGHVASTGQRLYRGLIGARTAYSSGRGTVADYARAARQAGLDFVVFLEDFEHLSADKLHALTADCARDSGPDLLLLPGFTITSNIGNRLFFFSPQPQWPPDSVLTGPAKDILYIQAQDPQGNYTGLHTEFLNWVLQRYQVEKGQVGYYDFADSPHGMRLHDARLYAMVGLRYYRNGRLVEDSTDDYLTTAASTSPPAPISVDEVSSPDELVREARSDHAMTYALAKSLDAGAPDGIFQSALRWSHQYDGMPIFMSSGPRILSWPGCFRVWTFGAEGFAPDRAVMQAPLHVVSHVGLHDVTIYDGDRLFRRFLLHGAPSFEEQLVLDGDIQRNLVVVAHDRRGGVAVSFARRSWADGGLAPTFCSDHINDGNMLLAHGPWPLPLSRAPQLAPDIAGRTWDGGPLGILPAISSQETLPTIATAEGEQHAARLDPIPRLDFSDEGAVGVESLRRESFDTRVERVLDPWNTYGPLDGPAPLFDYTQQYREWLAATDGAPATGWPAIGVRDGTAPSLFRGVLHFKSPVTVRSITLASLHAAPGAVLVLGDASGVRQTLALGGKSEEARVCAGCWFAVYGPKQPLNAFLFENRGDEFLLSIAATVDILAASEGERFQRGDDYVFELAAMAFPLIDPVTTDTQLAKYEAYLREPSGLQVIRGKRTQSPGLLEIAAVDGGSEISISQAQGLANLTLPVRLTALNPRWSAGVLQVDGYSAGFYGSGHDRYRALAVNADGTAYVPMYIGRAALTHMRMGHLVVADARGRDLFIQVTCLGGTPLRWHISVNNPSDRAITTTLRPAMDVPGLELRERKLTIPAGGYVVLPVKEPPTPSSTVGSGGPPASPPY